MCGNTSVQFRKKLLGLGLKGDFPYLGRLIDLQDFTNRPTQPMEVVMRKKLGIFGATALALTVFLSACSSSSSSSSEESSSAAVQPCQYASKEVLNIINEGMKSADYEVKSGFIADFSAEDIEAIKKVFPTYTSPKIFATHIDTRGLSGSNPLVTGLWGIQKFDYGWRITALGQTKKYSNLGADVTESSATGRVNAVMLELSNNTNVMSCLPGIR